MSLYLLDMLQSCMLGAMLLLGLLGFGFAAAMPGMDRWNKRFFMRFFVMVVLCVCVVYAEIIVGGDPDMIPVGKTAAFLESLFAMLMVSMPTVYLLHWCGEDWRRSALFRAVFASGAAYFALLVIAQFTTVFYHFMPDGRIAYGPWYPLTIVPVAAIMVLNLVGVLRRRDKLSRKRFYAFIVSLVPLIVAVLVHMIAFTFLLLDLGLTISAVAMFALVVSEEIEQYMRLQRETIRQRASIAVLQMRPHFIHNTMTSIYYLCDQDPKLAKQVTLDFNTYLRKNFRAIAKDEAVPFAEELEHTRAYLAVEQAQFATKLVVEYDTPHTQFCMPPLTLQPLAENAVKHGMSPQTVPLRVCIRTRKTGLGSEVVVEDNGSGFDPVIADRPHTTLSNIRQRLEMMCGGTLEIAPRAGGGTEAKVTLPG